MLLDVTKEKKPIATKEVEGENLTLKNGPKKGKLVYFLSFPDLEFQDKKG